MSSDNNLPLTIGLTGGIGSGKSSVSYMFSELGVPVIDTDQLGQELVQKRSPLLTKIVEHFGKNILSDSGDLDRKKLRKIIFANAKEKQWLEKLLHPEIRKLTLKNLANFNEGYVIVVVPLLLESNNYKFIDRVLLIDCSEELQLKRASSRDQSDPEDIKKIIAAQLPRIKRQPLADDIIKNEGSLDALNENVIELHEKYQQLSKQKSH